MKCHTTPTFFKGAQSVRARCSSPLLPSNLFQTSIQYTMKMYAVIHGVCGLFEGYSDTTCEFFPDKEAALKHIKQHVDTYREDEMCVNIEHDDDHPHPSTYVTMTRNHEDYHNSVTIKSMDHDDWVEENGDEVSVEVFRLIELDNPYRKDTTESVWLTWDQQDTCVAWDYNPLCMSLVARVTSDVMDTTNDDYPTQALHNLAQMGEFISDVYYRNHAFIDIDDYSMHAFRIPKKLNTND